MDLLSISRDQNSSQADWAKARRISVSDYVYILQGCICIATIRPYSRRLDR